MTIHNCNPDVQFSNLFVYSFASFALLLKPFALFYLFRTVPALWRLHNTRKNGLSMHEPSTCCRVVRVLLIVHTVVALKWVYRPFDHRTLSIYRFIVKSWFGQIAQLQQQVHVLYFTSLDKSCVVVCAFINRFGRPLSESFSFPLKNRSHIHTSILVCNCEHIKNYH